MSKLSAAVVGCFCAVVPLANGLAQSAATPEQGEPTVAFVPNLGQWQQPAGFVAQFGATTAYVGANGVRLAFVAPASGPCSQVQSLHERVRAPRSPRQGAAVDLRFVGAATVSPEADSATVLSGRRNFFVGAPSQWRTEVPAYGATVYRGLYAGVDARCYSLDGHFEYDVELAVGADLAAVVVEFAGAESLRLAADGALEIGTAAGVVRQPAPQTFVVTAQGRRSVAASYRLLGEHRFGFAVPDWDGREPLVIDPGILYSTVFGASATGTGVIPGDMARDANGLVTIVGSTDGLVYPPTLGAFLATPPGGGDLFVTQIDPALPTSQQHRYSTYLGGSGAEDMALVAVEASGLVTVTAWSDSTDYPTTPGAYTTVPAGYDCVVTRLDPTLTGTAQLVYSNHFGGSTYDVPLAINLGYAGEVVIAGFTDSIDYPTTPGAYDTSIHNPLSAAFVTVLKPAVPTAQQIVYSTYISGSSGDEADAVAMDVLGRVILSGRAESTNYPTTPGALQTVHGSPIQADAFVSLLDPALSGTQQLVYSTLFGGNSDDYVEAMAVDVIGSTVTIVGTTSSDNLQVTANAYQSSSPLPQQQYFGTFLTTLDLTAPAAQQLVYSTYLTGTNLDFVYDLAVDESGAMTVAGFTYSTDYPTTPGCYHSTFTSTNSMGFVSRLDPSLPPAKQLVYSTLLGDDSTAFAVALDSADPFVATVAGTAGPTHPTTPGAFGTPPGSNGAFLTRLAMRPTGIDAYGTASPGCVGLPAISTLSWPQVGNASFALYCTNAGPGSLGVAILNVPALPSALPVFGFDLWVAPVGALLVVVVADAAGRVELPFPMGSSPSLAGAQVHTQFAFYVPGASPCPAQGWSASDALSITVQP